MKIIFHTVPIISSNEQAWAEYNNNLGTDTSIQWGGSEYGVAQPSYYQPYNSNISVYIHTHPDDEDSAKVFSAQDLYLYNSGSEGEMWMVRSGNIIYIITQDELNKGCCSGKEITEYWIEPITYGGNFNEQSEEGAINVANQCGLCLYKYTLDNRHNIAELIGGNYEK